MSRTEVMVGFHITVAIFAAIFAAILAAIWITANFSTSYTFPNIINGFLDLENICFDTTFMFLR